MPKLGYRLRFNEGHSATGLCVNGVDDIVFVLTLCVRRYPSTVEIDQKLY